MNTENNSSATPAKIDLKTANLAEVLAAKPSYQELLTLGLAKLGELATETVQSVKQHTAAVQTFKESASDCGKLLSAMRAEHAKSQVGKSVGSGDDFAAYHKKLTGEKPWPRALQCSRVFEILVLLGHITEEDYEYCAVDWKEKGSTILGQMERAKMVHADGKLKLTEGVGLRMVEIFKKRPSKGSSMLTAISNEILGKVTTNTGEELTVKNMVAIVERGVEMDFNAVPGFSFIFTVLNAQVKKLATMDPARAAAFLAAVKVLAGETSDVPEPKPAETPVEKPASKPEKPAKKSPDFAAVAKRLLSADDADAVEAVELFHRTFGRLPKTADEINKHQESLATAPAA